MGNDMESSDWSRTIEYRPNRIVGCTFAAIFFLTAAILVWIGNVLGPDDVASMDGVNLILFTVVPISLFSWIAATVFALLGILILRRTLRTHPTLIILDEGLTLPTGEFIPWSSVISSEVKGNELIMALTEDMSMGRQESKVRALVPRWLRARNGRNQLILSSLALGADPAAVEAEIKRFGD